ncbi:hypothetical protein Q3G72_003381 [Acer saccharum]|nr:hypothetical protein Q3G72_003381 [Acer saccharum]
MPKRRGRGGGRERGGRGGSSSSGGRISFADAVKASPPVDSTPHVASTTTAVPAQSVQRGGRAGSSSSGCRRSFADAVKAFSLPQSSPPVRFTPPVAPWAGLPQSAPTTASTSFNRRRPCGTEGKKYPVKANHFLVQVEDRPIHRYEVLIYPDNKSMKVRWHMVSRFFHLLGESQLGNWIHAYDGRDNLYTAGPLPFESKELDVDWNYKVKIKVAPPNPDMYALQQFLEHRHLDPPREVIKVLDLVLKATPFKNNFLDGRSFFTPDLVPMEEGVGGVEYRKGFHQSLRPTQMGLTLNIDTSARGFYESILVSDFVLKHINSNLPVPLSEEDHKKVSNSLKGIRVSSTHLTYARNYKIHGISIKPMSQLSFTPSNQETEMTLVQYYYYRYKKKLKLTYLPALLSGNKDHPDLLPMELFKIVEAQRYSKGLNEKQEAALIKATLLNPSERESNIKSMVLSNNYNSDKIAHEEFHIHVGNELTSVDARILQAPMLNYLDNTGGEVKRVNPSLGHWDMSNKEFNSNPVIPLYPANPEHIERDLTYVYERSMEKIASTGKRLQLLIVILPNATGSYGNIKRVCETKLGIVSQCCRPDQASRLKDEYFQNIALKINVKVGGRNTVLDDAVRRSIPHVYDGPTIIIGADVTHAGQSLTPSIAAVVATMDWPDFTKYRGSISAQPRNQEMINDLYTTENGQEGGMIMELFKAFKISNRRYPQKIIFYRDGVGEDQFNQVLKDEVGAIRKACGKLNLGFVPPITFIVVQKRHNTRLFPADSINPDMIDDNRGNILPGTVVDTVICHPTEFDFYLNSHAGRKGTNRPTHYHVLLDENKFTADELQIFTNNLCYTYAKCTRSVSIVPPVFYAHLLASRARYYIEGGDSPDGGSSSGCGGKRGGKRGGKSGGKSGGKRGGKSGSKRETKPEVPRLPSIIENVKDFMFFC